MILNIILIAEHLYMSYNVDIVIIRISLYDVGRIFYRRQQAKPEIGKEYQMIGTMTIKCIEYANTWNIHKWSVNILYLEKLSWTVSLKNLVYMTF